MAWFEIKDLTAGTENKDILQGFSLTVNKGEVHAVMGPNGTGKSTLAGVITGNPKYTVRSGNIFFKGKNLLDMPLEERSWLGIFLGFQNPVEIDGVSVMTFLKYAVNAHYKAKGLEEPDAPAFLKMVRAKAETLGISSDILKRFLNVGFSGGEKKRIETLQMLMLQPDFCILDEMDSGLDIDALNTVSAAVNSLRDKERSFLLITHYDRLLTLIKPDFVHVMKGGKIIRTGSADLAKELEAEGYGSF